MLSHFIPENIPHKLSKKLGTMMPCMTHVILFLEMSHTLPKKDRYFYTHRHFYTQKLLHRNTFTHRDFLHIEAFTHKRFYTQTFFNHRHFYTHTRFFFYTQPHFHTQRLLLGKYWACKHWKSQNKYFGFFCIFFHFLHFFAFGFVILDLRCHFVSCVLSFSAATR